MKENKLKPCPFCGGEGQILYDDISDEQVTFAGLAFEIKCKSCYAKIQRPNTRKEAIQAWNRRRGE